MNQQVARKSNFEVELEAYEPQIAAALPAHVSPEKFRRVVMTAVARQPELYTEADRRTLFNSCVQCASDGLLPDNREAALVIFNTKDRKTNSWVKAVQYMPMIAGILKRMRNTGEVASADSQVVYQNDHFDYQLGDDARIIHKPTLGEPGAIIGAYAIIKLTNGEVLREVMPRSQIDQARAVSRSGDKENSPWSKWYGEMARKTVLRRCAKRAPVSPDLERLLTREDVEEAPALPPPPRPTRQSIAAPIEEPEPIDPAAAGHEDLDERFRATVDSDGVIHEPPAPAAATPGHIPPAGAPAVPTAEATQAPSQAAGGADAASDGYDGARARKALWEGAEAETTVAGLRAYVDIQQSLIDELKAKAPAEHAALGAAINARLRALRSPT